MARTTAKRKSESALPIGRSKLRHTTTRDDYDSGDEDEFSSGDKLFVSEQQVAARHVKKSKTRKSEPARMTRPDEYEQDEGRMESQQFLALVEFETKKKRLAGKAAAQYLDQFTQRLEESEQALKKHLQELGTKAPKQEEKFLERFSEAFATSRPSAPPAESEPQASSSLSFASLYKHSKNLTAAAKDVIKKFELADQMTSEIELASLLDNNWGDEDEEAAKLLGIGCEVGIQKYQCLLTASTAPTYDEEVTAMADMIYKKDDEQGSNAWGRIAKKQERSAKKLLKSFVLPEDI